MPGLLTADSWRACRPPCPRANSPCQRDAAAALFSSLHPAAAALPSWHTPISTSSVSLRRLCNTGFHFSFASPLRMSVLLPPILIRAPHQTRANMSSPLLIRCAHLSTQPQMARLAFPGVVFAARLSGPLSSSHPICPASKPLDFCTSICLHM